MSTTANTGYMTTSQYMTANHEPIRGMLGYIFNNECYETGDLPQPSKIGMQPTGDKTCTCGDTNMVGFLPAFSIEQANPPSLANPHLDTRSTGFDLELFIDMPKIMALAWHSPLVWALDSCPLRVTLGQTMHGNCKLWFSNNDSPAECIHFAIVCLTYQVKSRFALFASLIGIQEL